MAASQTYWYGKALQKVAEFLDELDSDLVAEVRSVRVTQTPGKPYAEHRSTLALGFWHRTNPSIRWTLEIGENDAYIEHRQQEDVTQMYKEKRGYQDLVRTPFRQQWRKCSRVLFVTRYFFVRSPHK